MTDQDEMREAIAREREQLQADMARRREQLDREEVLAEARQATPATKSYVPPIDHGRQRSAAPPADMVAAGWTRYISRSWAALGHQLESLALIEKLDGK
jgi:hypothetical protein